MESTTPSVDNGEMAGQISNIRLSRYDAQPWGFRLQGGMDFGTPLVVQKVNGGSLSEQAGLLAGDALLKVNGVDVYNMRHKDAQDLIVRSGNNFDITIQRGGSTWRPQVTPTGSLPSHSPHLNQMSPVTKTSLAHKQQEVHHIGSGHNSAARPFSSVNGSDGQVKSIVNKQYNTPVGIYSEEAIAETLSAQAEVLAGGVLGVNFKKNEKIYNAANSEVLKMLHEQENDKDPENQPRPTSPIVTKHVTAPVDRPVAPNTGGLPTGQNICSECERLIVGVFVRIKDKNLHAECFKCATCGTNLKNQGYYNFNNKLYCDIHARLAAMNNPPKGTEGYSPVPLKPNTKLSANTISAALNSHSQQNGSNHDPVFNVVSSVSPSLSHNHSRTSSLSSSSLNSLAGMSSSSSSQSSTMSRQSPDKLMSSPEKLSPAHSRQSSESGNTTNNTVFGHHPTSSATGSATIRTNSRTMSPVMSFPPPPPPPPPPSLPFDKQTMSPAATLTYSNEITINHRPKNVQDSVVRMPTKNGISENNVVASTRNGGISNGFAKGVAGDISTPGGDFIESDDGGESRHVLSQSNVYNTFLKKYANKMQNDFLDGPVPATTTNGSNHKSYSATKNTTNSTTPVTTDRINDSSVISGNVKMATSSVTDPIGSKTNGYTENGESIYGTIRPHNGGRKDSLADEFKYVTLDGSVIRSVIPPGKGVRTNYKVNTSYGAPKPFNTSPMSPPMRGPQSPSTYPPPTNVQSWDQPRAQPKPQVNPYATLPRTAGQSQGNINQSEISDETRKQVGNLETLDLPLPPPPPPLPGAMNGLNQSSNVQPIRSANTLPKALNNGSVIGNRSPKPFRPGLATEMLTNSLEKVEISDKQKFRDEAGKIISAMLENRLAQKTNNNLTKDLNANHPMKKIIDVCDSSKPSTVTDEPSAETNVKQTSGLILEVSTDGKILTGIPTEHGPSECVVFRNKSTNPNGKRELSTHAFDRRSYIDTNSSNNHQEPVSGEANVQADNTTTLVSDLKDGKEPVCCQCNTKITRGPFITALGRIWCPDHFVCVNGNCRRPLQDIGFVEEKGDLYCEFCFEKFLAPTCSKCSTKIKGDCLNAIGKHYHPECFSCSYCGKHFGNRPFFLEEGEAYCEADWNELFTTKCFACGFPVEAGDRWVEALNHNYHSQCFNCTMCKKNLEGQSFYNKGGRPFCKNHAR